MGDRAAPLREVELMLACARSCLASGEWEQIEMLLGQEIDWNGLVEIALPHGLMPLLHTTLSAFHETCLVDAVPAGLLSHLQERFRTNARRNVVLATRLLRLLSAFKAREIRVLPFKGPLLAVAAYGDLALRQFNDLDLLVAERDVEVANQLLVSQGYELKGFHSGWEAGFEDSGGVAVDLHWRIASSFDPAPSNFEELWTRATTVPVLGMMLPTLSAEDLLLTLSVQFVKDCRELKQRWVQLCDTTGLLRRHPGLDWDYVLGHAREAGGERILLVDLLLARELLSARIPERVSALMARDRAVPALARRLEGRLFGEPGEMSAAAQSRFRLWTDCILYLGAREHLADKLRYVGLLIQDRLAYLLTPSERDRRFVALPRPLGFLYYFVRPFRVLDQWARTGSLKARTEPGAAAMPRLHK